MKKLLFILPLLFNANLAFGYITSDIPNGCDIYHKNMDPVFTINEYNCNSGYYLPADGIACEECRPGYTCTGGIYEYNQNIEQGINLRLQNLVPANGIAGCDEFYDDMYPVFTANQYTCDTGYYLPAGQDWLTDNDGCRLCPADSYCVGGTYTFNETTAQGITACPVGKISDAGSDDVSDCRDPAINCSAGYYLPANASVCSICPGDSYCVGGTYNLETNVPQGIVSCASGLFAPAGMWEVAQCGRILHVGDGFVYLRSTKKTTPSVNVDLDHDGVADYFGNMTTLDVPMSRDTQRKLKLRYNNTTYSVYDDSVDLTQYAN